MIITTKEKNYTYCKMKLVLLFSFSFAKIRTDEKAALTNKVYRLNIHSLLLAQNCIIAFRFLDEPMTCPEAIMMPAKIREQSLLRLTPWQKTMGL